MTLTTGSDPLHEQRGDWVRPTYGLFLQILGFVCLIMGLVYWSQLTGIAADSGRRFDLLDTNPRIVLSILAVILPFAGLGLWFQSSWGIVVWLGCAALQVSMYTVWTLTFGTFPALIVLNALCLLVLLAFNIWFFIRWRATRV